MLTFPSSFPLSASRYSIRLLEQEAQATALRAALAQADARATAAEQDAAMLRHAHVRERVCFEQFPCFAGSDPFPPKAFSACLLSFLSLSLSLSPPPQSELRAANGALRAELGEAKAAAVSAFARLEGIVTGSAAAAAFVSMEANMKVRVGIGLLECVNAFAPSQANTR